MVRSCCPVGDAVLFTLARDKTGMPRRLSPSRSTPACVTSSWKKAQTRGMCHRSSRVRAGNTLLAVPFDVGKLAVTGGPVPLVEGVGRAPNGLTGAAHFAVSGDGALVYAPTDAVSPDEPRTLVWVDRRGREEPFKAPPHPYFDPRLSPDGTRVALDRSDQEDDIWIFYLGREALTRLTFGPAMEFPAIWTPNGQAVLFSSGQFGVGGSRNLFRKAADGTGTLEQLTQGPAAHMPYAVTPDATGLIFGERKPMAAGIAASGTDLMLLPLVGERHPQPLYRHLSRRGTPTFRRRPVFGLPIE